MSTTRYKTLLSYLPGMASVVNSFQSEQVQLAVFDRLMEALDEKTEPSDTSGSSTTAAVPQPAVGATTSDRNAGPSDVVHDLVEGDSIHAELDA